MGSCQQVNRRLKELGDTIPVNEKARIEQLANELQTALKEQAAIERIKSLHSDLEQAAHSLAQAAHAQTAAGSYQDGGSAADSSDRSDVVDAEFEEK